MNSESVATRILRALIDHGWITAKGDDLILAIERLIEGELDNTEVHEPECPCYGDSVVHAEDCANCECEYSRADFRNAIAEFGRTRGKHAGEHDQLGGIHCSKCVAAYSEAEEKLDAMVRGD